VFNRLVASPGQNISLGASGGVLLLAPSKANPGQPPGSMPLSTMQARLFSMIREDGPDTGYPLPTTGDFTAAAAARDLTIALAQFISDTGLAPDLLDRRDDFPVYPVLDQPLPLGCTSLHRIEYKPRGQQLYTLRGLSMNEFDNTIGSVLPADTGQPYYYREPYAGYVRLQPQPGPGQAQNMGTGQVIFLGIPTVGDTTYLTVSNGIVTVITESYVTEANDTLASIASALIALLDVTVAITNTGPPILASAVNNGSNTITLTAFTAPGTEIMYSVTTTSTTMTATPTVLTNFNGGGDTITFYYASLGVVLALPGDTPGIPPQFHIGPVYRVASDYWLRKQDFNQAKSYLDRYEMTVAKAKAFTFDTKRSTQPSVGGDSSEFEPWPVG
jgi:hypothetical protein